MQTFAPKQTPVQEAKAGRVLSSRARGSGSLETDGELEDSQGGRGEATFDFARVGIFAPQAGRIQRKLTINTPGDEYEQQAERVAEQVMRTTEAPQVQRACGCGGSCSKCSGDEEPEVASMVQRSPRAEGGEVLEAPPVVSEVLRSGGRALDRSTSNFMESRFGYDFSQVRVHTDSRAAKSARAIDARAYTAGTDVVFGQGQFEPSSAAGRRLLAHELTHVVQQRPARRAGPMGLSRATGDVVQRDKPEPKPFAGCTTDNTLEDKPVDALGKAVKFAANLVDAALAAIERNDSSNANYKAALAKHFRSPNFSDLKDIHRNFRFIFFHLKPENYACAATNDDFDECEKVVNNGFDIAFTPVISGIGTGATVLCPVFWFNNLACRAETLIHEAAHAVGIGDGSTHPPNRGQAGYPALDTPQPASQTVAARKDNPDAYGYFAAQIGRETDTECDKALPAAPISPRGAIKIGP